VAVGHGDTPEEAIEDMLGQVGLKLVDGPGIVPTNTQVRAPAQDDEANVTDMLRERQARIDKVLDEAPILTQQMPDEAPILTQQMPDGCQAAEKISFLKPVETVHGQISVCSQLDLTLVAQYRAIVVIGRMTGIERGSWPTDPTQRTVIKVMDLKVQEVVDNAEWITEQLFGLERRLT